jgi:hypothetical protein
MCSACHFCCFCWRFALSGCSVLVCSEHPDLNDITHLGSLRGSVASEPLHLQGLVLLWNVLLLLQLLQGFCCLGQASTSSYCILTTNRKHNDCSRGASTRTTFCNKVLKLFTIYGHGRAHRLARNVLQGLQRIDCDPYASDLAGKGNCNRLSQTPGLVKPSTPASSEVEQ